ncbi:MAG: hypothetical protein R3D45_05765 [Rhizobiaceae bacterium]
MMRILAAVLLLCSVMAPPLAAQSVEPGRNTKVWVAGAYSFSDELGGFTILAASGTGTRDDPIVIEQELSSASPVIMVIRARRTIRPYALAGDYANGMINMRIKAINGSGLPWLEFEFELQEVLRQPSVYGDGLSFDQRSVGGKSILSNRFNRFDDRFEPYDRLIYFDGNVDPLDSAEFSFMITDFTPQPEFYLLLDPRIPSS